MKIAYIKPIKTYRYLSEFKAGLNSLHDFKIINSKRRIIANRNELIDDGYSHVKFIINGEEIIVKLDDRTYHQKIVSEYNKGYCKSKKRGPRGTARKNRKSIRPLPSRE